MKKRTLSFFLFGLLTLSLAVVSAALYLVDWNQYRDTLASLASERLGVRVELAGDLNLTLLPRPTVAAKSVRLSPLQTDFNETIATAEQIDMHLGLAAALGGSIELQSLSLEGAAITLIETAEGWGIQGWPKGADEDSETSADALLSLDRFRIKSGSVTLERMSGVKIDLEGLEVAIAGTLPNGPVNWDGSAFVSGEPFTLSGRIVPVKSTGETSLRVKLGAAGASADFSGRFGNADEISGRLQGTAQNLSTVMAFVDVAFGAESAFTLPELPASFDLQIEKTRNVSSIVSRQLSIGETLGTMELTLVERLEDWHVTGRTTFGVVDADHWLTESRAMPEPNASGSSLGLNISGSVDLIVEGLKYQGDIIQQIEAVIAFNQSGVGLSQARAFLPGASRFSYVADKGLKGGELSFESGRLPEIFKWIGLPLSSAVPAGRLTTAAITGQLTLNDGAWFLADIAGTVDTSQIDAELSGNLSPFSTQVAKARIDNINLDAYWPDPVFSAGDEDLNLPEIELDLRVDKLHWQHTAFKSVSLRGILGGDSVSVSHFEASEGDNDVSGNFAVRNFNAVTANIAADIQVNNWMFPTMRALYPETVQTLDQFSGGYGISGNLIANGLLSKMQGQVRLIAGENELQLAGSAGFKEEWQFDLQGNLKHKNTARLAGISGDSIPSGEFLATTVNLNVSGSSLKNVAFRVNGSLAGDQINLAGQYSPGKTNLAFNLSGNRISQQELASRWGPYSSLFRADATRRVRFDLEKIGADLSIKDFEYSSGDAAFTGDLQFGDARVIGAVSAVNWSLMEIERLLLSRSSSDAFNANYAGFIDISLTDFDLDGQKLSVPKGSLTLSDDRAALNMGEGALLNKEPVSGSGTYQYDSETLSMDLQGATLDLAALFSSLGAPSGISGNVRSDLSIKAMGATPEAILASLTGHVSFVGNAGTLNFLDVPKLVTSLMTSERKTGFLSSLGTILRGGATDFTKIEGTLRLDNGVALIEKVLADGDWGILTLDGQANLSSDLLNISGVLDLNQPIDTPNIPVTYTGPLSEPNARWTTVALEQFGMALMERRLRSTLFGEMEQSEQQAGGVPSESPGNAILGTAFDLLSKLRANQLERKQLLEEKESASPPRD